MQKVSFAVCFIIVILGFGCMSSNQSTQSYNRSGEPDQHYTSSFPDTDVSGQLQQIQHSVLRFTVSGFYTTYFFNDRNITLDKLQQTEFTKAASRTSTLDKSKAGTAISILRNDNHTVLITARHILSFPDTVVVYKRGRNIPERTFVLSVGVKNRQRNYLYTHNQILSLEVIAQDRAKDLALVKVPAPESDNEAPPLKINLGESKKLQPGSFVYVLGYPLGSPMITRGIVSAPDYDNKGAFLTDALFNHGISGGLIIASRTNFSSFEWVGMAVSASATEQRFLIPDPSKEETYEHLEAYTDTAYVSEKWVINYGLTQAIPSEDISTFLLSHEDELNNLGFSASDIIN